MNFNEDIDGISDRGQVYWSDDLLDCCCYWCDDSDEGDDDAGGGVVVMVAVLLLLLCQRHLAITHVVAQHLPSFTVTTRLHIHPYAHPLQDS